MRKYKKEEEECIQDYKKYHNYQNRIKWEGTAQLPFIQLMLKGRKVLPTFLCLPTKLDHYIINIFI